MPYLLVQDGAGRTVAHRLADGGFRIGRAADNDLVLGHGSVSRRHAEVRCVDGACELVDLGSRHGTRVNGRRLDRHTPLKPGDAIAIGDGAPSLRFALELEPEAAEQTATDSRVGPAGAATADGAAGFIGDSAAQKLLLSRIDAVAPWQAPVLIRGESGTGKELAARRLHARSPRRDRPWVAVNCPAIPDALFEAELFGVERGVATGVDPRQGLLATADGGTLFLDEIGDLGLAGQAKLLRFLQERTITPLGGRRPQAVDVRVVAATNHPLEEDVANDRFRRDLFHRLAVVTLTVPPLRERREDLPSLVAAFLQQPIGPTVTIREDALQLLAGYDFPGNVRELEGLLGSARLFARGAQITPADLPPHIAAATGAGGPDLYARLIEGGESFWDVVWQPFTRHELAKDEVRALIERGHRETGSYKAMARLFRVDDDRGYKKLLDFLRNNDLRIRS